MKPINEIREMLNDERCIKVLDRFAELYPEHSAAEMYSAPGRTEVCGNHTDHQRGRVLAASIILDSVAAVAPREDNRIRIDSDGFIIDIDITSTEQVYWEEGTTDGIVRGMAHFLSEGGYKVGGFDACVTSNVPMGAGLSSSAMFESLAGVIFSGLYNNMEISAETIAIAGMHSEIEYYGKASGCMDQMACSLGNLVMIDFEDNDNPVIEQIDCPMEELGYTLCIIDTKGSHEHLTHEYDAVPNEMCAVAELLGHKQLRDVTMADVLENINAIRESAGDRALMRAMHCISENDRVLAAAEALRNKDVDAFLKVINASGNSSYKYLQNVYSVDDTKSQNVAVALCVSELALGGRGATRVHGGGFAGTIQSWVPNDILDDYIKAMDDVFGKGATYVMQIRDKGIMRIVG